MSKKELEAAIEKDFDDKQAWQVYADLLQSEGDARGELIAVGVRGLADEESALLAKHRDVFIGDLAKWETTMEGRGLDRPAFTWHFGFIRDVRLAWDHYADEKRGPIDLGQAVRDIFGHPSGRFIRNLTIGVNRADPDQIYQPVLDAIAAVAPPCLETLFVGDYEYPDQSEISWTEIGDLGGVLKAAPKLRSLKAQGGSIAVGAASPTLRTLVLHSGGLPAATVNSIVAHPWPELVELTLWLGRDEYGGDASLDNINALLASDHFPSLKHLGLANSEIADALIPLILASPMLARLRVLDLSKGTLTDDGARALLAGKARWQHLEELDLGENYLADTVEELRAAGNVNVEEQREADEDDGEVYRYSAVGE